MCCHVAQDPSSQEFVSLYFQDHNQIYTILKHPYSDRLQKIETCVSMSNKLALNARRLKLSTFVQSSKFVIRPALTSLHIGDCHVSVALA